MDSIWECLQWIKYCTKNRESNFLMNIKKDLRGTDQKSEFFFASMYLLSLLLNLIFIFSYYFLIYKNVLVLTQVLQLSNSSFIDITVCCIYWVVKSFPPVLFNELIFFLQDSSFPFLNFLLPISHWLIPPIYVVEHAMVCQSYFPCRIKGFISPSYWDSCQLTPHSYQSTVWIASARCSI